MIKPIIEEYKYPKKLDKKIYSTFEGGDADTNKKLAEHGLIYLCTSYSDIKYTSCWHHNKRVSIVIDTDEKEIYLIGLKNNITKAKKDLEFLLGKSLELIGEIREIP